MKETNKLSLHQLRDSDYQTISGGHDCEGTQTQETILICEGPLAGHEVIYDWKDEGCCEQ